MTTRLRPRTRRTRSPRRRSCRRPSRRSEGIDQEAIRDWLHENEVQTILGPLSWDETGEPKGKFLLAQWQSGKVRGRRPPEAATVDKVVNPKPDWK